MLYNQKWHDIQDLERYSGVIAKNHEIKIRTDKNNIWTYSREVVDGVISPTQWYVCKNGFPEIAPAEPVSGIGSVSNLSLGQGAKQGSGISINQNTLAIGSDEYSLGPVDMYEYIEGTWTYKQQLINPDAPTNISSDFGHEIALEGDIMAIGAPYWDDVENDVGAIYVYERIDGTWEYQLRLAREGGHIDAADNYGTTISISNGIIVAGCSKEDVGGLISAGALYTYEKIGEVWTQTQRVVAETPIQADYFGISISISNNTIVSGMTGHDDKGNTAGTVEVFDKVDGIWTYTTKIFASDAAGYDAFGGSVKIHNDRIVVGAKSEDTGQNGAGSAYIFDRTGGVWSETTILRNPTPEYDDRFGMAVALYGDTVIIGAPMVEATPGTYSGETYVYILLEGIWTLKETIFPPNPEAVFHGEWIDIYDDKFIIGDPYWVNPENGDAQVGRVRTFNVGLASRKTVYIGIIDPLLRQFYENEEIPIEVTIN